MENVNNTALQDANKMNMECGFENTFETMIFCFDGNTEKIRYSLRSA